MALSEEDILKAKAEARKYLEYSTYTLALTLGVDPEDIEYPYSIPVADTHPDHALHQSLASQVAALDKL